MKEVALITGSTSGIGAATAELFAAHGYHVVVTGRNAGRGEAVRARIAAAGGAADFFAADLTRQAEAQALATHAASLGQLSVVVNCAGSNKPGMSLEEHFAINYKAGRFTTEAALAHMEAGACVITVTSVCAESRQAHGGSPYADAKAALTAFAFGQLSELTRKNIRTHVIAPGVTHTPDTAHLSAAEQQLFIEQMPLTKGLLDPSQIAQTIYDVSTWIWTTGQTIVVDGGMTALSG